MAYQLPMRKVKLIWDFRGPDALKIAEHHAKHLKEFVSIKNFNIDQMGSEALTDVHAIAFMVVEEPEVIALRDILKPHRGLIYKS